MKEQLALLPELAGAHLRLTLAALAVGLALSLPLGVLVTRRRWLERPVLALASVIQTIPSLALLAIMVPLLAAAHLRSIGFTPAFLGLVLYSVLPILRNTVTGIRGVDPVCIKAARGIGMTPWQQLMKVELPLALPVIVAGIRTSTVWTVGVATLSTPVGATSLGNYIFGGLQMRNFEAVAVGCVAAAVLALALDGVVRVLAAATTARGRRRVVLASGALVVLGSAAALSFVTARSGARDRVVIGSKTFTEQYVLAEILRATVEGRTGAATETAQSLGSTVAFDALRSGEIDTYVDYSGTLWTTVLHRREVASDRPAMIAELARELRAAHGVVLVGALGFENAYALAMTRERAARLGIRSISDLARTIARPSIGGDYEFFARPEWQSIEAAYRLETGNQVSMDSALMYQAVAAGEVDAISAFSTDGRITALDLVVLDDDRSAIPPYDALILASGKLADRRPDVIDALRDLIGAIDADAMRSMNLAIDRDGESPATVARRFVAHRGDTARH